MSASTILPGAQAFANHNSGIEVSIIIISFNTRDLLHECLSSCVSECAGLSAELIVVDNASTDGSLDMIAQDFPQAVVIKSEINLGFGVANNVALEQARGRYFVLLNSDAFFTPGSLGLAIRHMDETPKCGLGGALLIGRNREWQPSAKTFHSIVGDAIVLTGLSDKFPRSPILGRANRTWSDESKPAIVDWVPGAFAILRPAALEKIGLFDPIFFLYYEEVDLCFRLKQAGFEVWYWPDIEIIHVGGQSSRKLKTLEFSSRTAQVVLWRMRSTLLYYRKHHGGKVWLAKWLEKILYNITVFRNRFSKVPERRDRERHYRVLLKLLDQAWRETKGGRISPPRPW